MNTDWHDLIQRHMAGTLDDAESEFVLVIDRGT